MRGIREERLKEIAEDSISEVSFVVEVLLARECNELNDWKPIDENTPKNRQILVYAPGPDGLDYLITPCKWHEDAGFCIDELRDPTHWQELPTPPKNHD